MPLITCPECNKNISDRAEFCPHCGLPAKYFTSLGKQSTTVGKQSKAAKNEPKVAMDMAAFRNTLISFEHSYQTYFSQGHYITNRELTTLNASFEKWAKKLSKKSNYDYCKKNAPKFSIDMGTLDICLRRYETLAQDVESHNEKYVDRIVAQNKSYFDNLLKDIDPNIKLDEEQRRAVVTDDDYCLLVAGAGAGKTTTMAAKVKYLVEKKHIPPEDIIVISYTNKAIEELKERINKGLRIPAKICTFHKFAYDIIREFSDVPPEVNYSANNIIFEMLEKNIFDDKKFLKKVLLFLGYYFDLPADAMNYDNLNQFHLAKAAQDYETIKSGAGDYVKKIADGRSRSMKTLTGEYLRSIQEAQIANFLYLNGLDYEYEPVHPYPIKNASKKYTPDFVIRQGTRIAYLEHYAISENGVSNILTEQEIHKYRTAIKDKRNHHKKYDTRLLETWSRYKDKRPLSEHLRETLEKEGFVLKERDFAEVYQKIVDTSKDKYVFKLMEFLKTFISQFKTCGYDVHGFELLKSKSNNIRTNLFLEIAETVYKYYQEQLASQNRIDFEDMINDANRYLAEIERQNLSLPYKYIIIDEFQDIARQRFNLTKRLSEITSAKVVAVGDDWQSIYAFAGSEISLFTRFLELMGSGVEMKITHTYRNSQELIDIAGGFVQKNSSQIKKKLISPKQLDEPIVLCEFDDSFKPDYAMAEAAEKTIEKIINEYGASKEILLIGRYNYDGYKICRTGRFTDMPGNRIKSEKFPKVNLTFMTAHSAKGLGFDNVILLNMFEGKFGFPCQIEDDPIMKLVRYEDTSVPFAEERRLLYVALTRTKNRVYILTPQKKPSRFLIELVNDYKIPHSKNVNKEMVDLFRLRCPACNYPLKYEFNKNYGLGLYLCTNEPEVCDFMTNNKTYLQDIYKCHQCKDGYMIVKTMKDKALYGCTGYDSKAKSGCSNVQSIKI